MRFDRGVVHEGGEEIGSFASIAPDGCIPHLGTGEQAVHLRIDLLGQLDVQSPGIAIGRDRVVASQWPLA